METTDLIFLIVSIAALAVFARSIGLIPVRIRRSR